VDIATGLPPDAAAIFAGLFLLHSNAREHCLDVHALRHTRASSLIAAGVDILTISRRLGHANPKITLDVYGHLYGNTDDKVAQAALTNDWLRASMVTGRRINLDRRSKIRMRLPSCARRRRIGGAKSGT
jgi:hypothetical protein